MKIISRVPVYLLAALLMGPLFYLAGKGLEAQGYDGLMLFFLMLGAFLLYDLGMKVMP